MPLSPDQIIVFSGLTGLMIGCAFFIVGNVLFDRDVRS